MVKTNQLRTKTGQTFCLDKLTHSRRQGVITSHVSAQITTELGLHPVHRDSVWVFLAGYNEILGLLFDRCTHIPFSLQYSKDTSFIRASTNMSSVKSETLKQPLPWYKNVPGRGYVAMVWWPCSHSIYLIIYQT